MKRLGRLGVALAVALTPAFAYADVMLGDRQDGEQVRVPAGAVVDVRLISNPSTGYTWRMLGGGRAVRLMSQGYDAPSPTRRTVLMVGRPGVQSFRVRVLAPPGRRVALRFAYRRWWTKVGLARVWAATLLTTPGR